MTLPRSYAEARNQEPDHRHPRFTVAYLGGIGRSGSTLVSRILDRIPDVVSVGELVNVWHQSVLRDTACGCGAPFSACPFWQQVGLEAFGGWDHDQAQSNNALRTRVDRLRHLPALLRSTPSRKIRADVQRYRATALTLLTAISTVSGCSIIVDNSKIPSRAALLRGIPEIDLRVLHLIRSSYGVSHSWSKQLTRPDADQAMLRMSVAKSAARWTMVNAAFEVLSRSGVDTLTLRYEDIVEHPEAQVRRILNAVGKRVVDADLSFIHDRSVDLRVDHSVWGNPMRMRVGPEALRLDEDWRRALRVRDKRIITVLTAPGMHHYGYALNG